MKLTLRQSTMGVPALTLKMTSGGPASAGVNAAGPQQLCGRGVTCDDAFTLVAVGDKAARIAPHVHGSLRTPPIPGRGRYAVPLTAILPVLSRIRVPPRADELRPSVTSGPEEP